MPARPLLIMPTPRPADRDRGQRQLPRVSPPSDERQRQRLGPVFERIGHLFTSAQIQSTPTGLEPEKALVLEVAGSVQDFMRAVRFEGVEWLGELLADLDQDEDFSLTGDEEEDADDLQEAQPIRGRLYMLMADRRGWAELQSLWVRYQANPDQRFEHGLNKWKSLFKFLRGIRPWGAEDRKAGTGVEDYWRAELDANAARVRFEVELWYREDQRRRDAGLASLRDLVAGAGGSVITSAAIPEIAYHAALVELPGGSLRPLLEGNDPRLLQLDQIMFFQPLGQARSGPAIGSAGPLGDAAEREVPRGREPIAAILDGLPLENHELLRDRLIVDDPDGWARNYQAIRRVHGTAMASLVVHGDLAAGERPLESPVYLRPIMRPDPHLPEEEECTPPDQLLVDLMHRAVRRLFEPSEGQDPVAPSVRVINLSVGDRLRRFDQVPSAWARLLDWLSHKHDVLFVIAAGNHTDAIELPVPPDAVRDLRGPRLEDAILRTLRDSRWARRLVIPAEAMNAITVGGLHHDASGNAVPGRLIEPFATPSMPSIFNPIASGIRRAIKPEVLFNAGRQLLTEPTPAGGSSRMWLAQPEERGPGQVIARPSPTPGEVRARCHSWGTSNAAALATRAAAFIYDIIEDLRTTHGGDQLDRAVEAQLIKALLVHGAAWDTRTRARIEELIEDRSAFKKRSLVTSFLGYGSATIERVLDCTQHRVTLVGVGSLANDRGHRFSLPIPEAFARRAMRRAVITLAWISPVLPRDQRYRQAKLWFDPEPLKSMLRMERSDGDWRAVRRGTVQHEVLEGEAAIVIPEAATAELVVSCRAEGGRLPRPVRYALVVTLEIAEAIEVDIYEEVRAAIQVAVRTRPVGRTTQ